MLSDMPAEDSSLPVSLGSIDVPITIEFSGEVSELTEHDETRLAADAPWLQSIREAVHVAAQSQGYGRGQIGVLVTDDPTIHEINRRHLQHDYPTDVISFPYGCDADHVEGELVVSLCTARRWAAEVGWDWQTELLLYVVHGTLHICGLEDSTAEQRQQMRAAEQAALAKLGIRDADGLSRGFDSQRRDEPEADLGADPPHR
jgi:probable rRNA maturation factor